MNSVSEFLFKKSLLYNSRFRIASHTLNRRLKFQDGFYIDQGTTLRKLPARFRLRGKLVYRYMDRIFSLIPISNLSESQSKAICDIRLDYFEDIVDNSFNLAVIQYISLHLSRFEKPFNLLDFGCGNGLYTKLLFRSHPLANITGADISEKAIQLAVNQNLRINWVQLFSDGKIGVDENYYDVIISTFVMHFNVEENLIIELARVLKPSGFFIFNIFNRKYLQNNLSRKLINAGFKITRLFPQERSTENLFFIAQKHD